MKKSKVKIVLDADVIIHFYHGENLGLLPQIFENCEYIVLDYVYEEVLTKELRVQVQKLTEWFNNLKLVEFAPSGEIMHEYAQLLNTIRGKGESACLIYCKYNHDVIGSSNLSDILDYCTQNGIAYLTTCDFLYYAWRRGKMTVDEVNDFVAKVKSKNSKLPKDFDVEHYSPNTPM